MKKRIISVLLAVCMLITLTSTTAMAASQKHGVITSVSTFSGILKDLIPGLTKGSTKPTSVYDLDLHVAAGAGLDGDVSINISKDTNKGKIYLPGSARTDQLGLAWTAEGITVSVNGTTYENGTVPVPAAGESLVYAINNGVKTVNVTLSTLQGSGNVSSLFLNVDESLGTISAMNNDETKETLCYGTTNVSGKTYQFSMKGRGNSTWDMAKKPYNITFYKNNSGYSDKKKVALINGVEAKKWSLLANYMDNSLLRNKVGQDLACAMGIGLDADYIDLYMNGEYLGNYLVTVKNDRDTPDTGFMLENDNYLDTDQFSLPGVVELGPTLNAITLGSLNGYYNRMTIKDIGDDAGVTNDDIANITTQAWNALINYNSEDYQNYWDIESWAKMYLMYEFTKSYDCFSGSVLMTYDTDSANPKAGKFVAGPAWDMDTTIGRTMYKFFCGVTVPAQVTAQGWFVDSIGLAASNAPFCMLQEFGKHKSFLQEVARVYHQYEYAFVNVRNDIDNQANRIEASAAMDADLWGLHHMGVYYYFTDIILGTGKYALPYDQTQTWRDYVNNMRLYAEKRQLWLSDNLASGKTIRTTHVPYKTVIE